MARFPSRPENLPALEARVAELEAELRELRAELAEAGGRPQGTAPGTWDPGSDPLPSGPFPGDWELLRTILEVTPWWLAVHDREGRLVMVSRHMAEECGMTPEAMIGLSYTELPHSTPAQKIAILAHHREVLAQGTPVARNDVQLILPGGGHKTLHVVKAPLAGESGEIVGVLSICEDVTERRESAARIRRLVEESMQGIVVVQDAIIVFANDAEARMMGYDSAPELVGQRRDDHIAPHELERLRGYAAARERGEPAPAHYEFEGRRRDGTLIWLECTAHPTTWNGRPAQQSFHVEISERHRAERELAEYHEQLEWLSSRAPAMLYRYRTHRERPEEVTFTFITPYAKELTGFTAEELTADPKLLIGRYHPDDIPGWRAEIQRVTELRADWSYDLRYRHKDGHYIWIHTETWRHYLPDGHIEGAGYWADITKQKTAQLAFEKHEALLSALLQNTQASVFLKDPSGHYMLANRAFAERSRMRPEEIVGKHTREVLGEETSRQVAANEAEVMRRGESIEFEEWRRGDGDPRIYRTQRFPLRDRSGAIVALGGISLDVTESRLAEIELERFFELSVDMLAIIGRDGTVREVSPAFERILGLSRTSILNRPMADLLHPDDEPAARRAMARLIKGKPVVDLENRARRWDGSHVWLSWRAVFDRESGSVYAVGRDVTGRRRADEALRESESQFRRVAEGSVQGLMVHSHLVPLYANAAVARMLGFDSPDQVLALESYLPYLAEPERIAAYARARQAGGKVPQEYETRMIRRDGAQIWVQVMATLIAWRGESAILTTLVDITQRKAAEQALRDSEERYRTLVEGSLQGMVIQRDFKALAANTTAAELFGFPSVAELLATDSMLDRVAPHERERIQGYYRARLQGGHAPERFEAEYIRLDGTPITLEVRGRVVIWEEAPAVQITLVDVTDRKRAEEALRRYSERLERSNRELEDFAFVASHDLQEPLRKIQSFGEVLAEELGDGLTEEAGTYLGFIRGAAERMQNLIRDLLALSRLNSRAGPATPVSLDGVLREVLSNMEQPIADLGAQIVAEPLAVVQADPTQLFQLLQNLISNALKYHGEATPEVQLSGRALPDSGMYELTVSDNGIGFEPKHARRIFGVFQRLHGRDKFEGTGMGLTICQRIVERHGGRIVAHGTPGQGARFVLTLPLAPEPPGEIDG